MKIKPILKGLKTAANICIVAASAKALYNKFSSSDDEDEDDFDEDDNDEDLDEETETDDDDEGAED